MATERCEVCGISWETYEATQPDCEGGEECHDWEDSMNDDEMPEGENVIIGGQSAYKVGGFITWD